ncbi:hypothetical protein GCM10010399_21300 [Dactylosporangium fulvum]
MAAPRTVSPSGPAPRRRSGRWPTAHRVLNDLADLALSNGPVASKPFHDSNIRDDRNAVAISTTVGA